MSTFLLNTFTLIFCYFIY